MRSMAAKLVRRKAKQEKEEKEHKQQKEQKQEKERKQRAPSNSNAIIRADLRQNMARRR